MLKKSYNQEQFTGEINRLIQKCEPTILKISERFKNKDCLAVKDLYKENTSYKQIIIKFIPPIIQINPNTIRLEYALIYYSFALNCTKILF